MWLLCSLLIVLSLSCGERRTEVRLEGTNPPVFVMSGSGNLVEFRVTTRIDDNALPLSKRSKVIWRIVPKTRDGERVERIGSITYGVVPAGYKQAVPDNGESPPLLAPGKYYAYALETINAPHASGYFEIRNGKAEKVYGVGHCYGLEGGKEIEVPCNDQYANQNSNQPTP